MAEFIGARISLVSKSDIRYVGTLHEINSETSTVALENVSSFGTEGRKQNPDDEIPPSDSVYEYIVFRGSDVKDLRIEEAPVKENKPPQMPNDPAILGARPAPAARQAQSGPSPQASQPPPQQPSQAPQGPQGPQGPQSLPPPGAPQYGQHPYPFYPPPPNWGRGGPAYPGMPYGAPPAWLPPPGPHGFPQPPPGAFPPGAFPPYAFPPGQGPPGQFPPDQQAGPKPAPIGAKQSPSAGSQAEQAAPKQTEDAVSPPADHKAPTPPVASKPTPTEIQEVEQSTAKPNTRSGPALPKVFLGVQPAIPFTLGSKAPQASGNDAAQIQNAATSLRDATQAATAAVAAAMAKLPPVGGQTNGNAVDNLTRKVSEMRTTDHVRAPRQPAGGASGFAPRGRGGARGGGRAPSTKVEVPETDYNFEEANAKFDKQTLVKESVAGDEVPANNATSEAPAPVYNKASSFFDNISSESKDRLDGSGTRPGGREWRGEEQKKNVETFGQGSVDNGYRGGFRGRARGRGYRGRGYGRGRGGPGGYRGGGDGVAGY